MRKQKNVILPTSISVSQARQEMKDIVNRVAYGKERIFLTSHNMKMVALVPVEDIESLEALENAADIREAKLALKEINEKGSISLEEMKKRLAYRMTHSIYTIEFAPRTEDQLKKIPKAIRKLIMDRIEILKENPRPENTEPLQGNEKGLFPIRQGDYRIVYSIQDKILMVLIVRVVHRKEVYTKKHSK